MKNEIIQLIQVHNQVQLNVCLKIRETVFIIEQNVPREIEIDEHDTLEDPIYTHYLYVVNGMPVGTARTLQKPNNTIKIQRFAILKEARSKGYGKRMLSAIETTSKGQRFVLSAQVHALNFYEKCGYHVTSEVYLEADIQHRDMEKTSDH